MPQITLTPTQIRAFPNHDWASPDDDVVVVCDLPTDDQPNPPVEYIINGEQHDSQESWSNLPPSWQRAFLRQAIATRKAATALGSLGGRANTPAQNKARAANGRLGGRHRKTH